VSFESRIPGTRAWRRRRWGRLCVEVAIHIDEIVDGELPATRKAKILERHLTGCSTCRGEAEVIVALKRGVARVSQEADAETVARLRELARRLCSGEDVGA
jgi:anti-sigma factor RsiW